MTTNLNIFVEIEPFDNAAKIAALRSLIHSCMSRAIGAGRAHLNNLARAEREEGHERTGHTLTDLDLRNQLDEYERGEAGREPPVGLAAQEEPLILMQKLHGIADQALHDLRGLAETQWDMPMDFSGMIGYMTERPRPPDEAMVQAAAQYLKADPAKIREMVKMTDNEQRLRLASLAPKIIDLWNNFGEGYGSTVDFEELDLGTKLGLTIKTINGIKRTSERVLANAFARRRLQDLGTCAILDDAAKQLTTELRAYEKAHSGEISQLVDAGRMLPELIEN